MAVLIPGKILYLRTPCTASTVTERAIIESSEDRVRIRPGHCTAADVYCGRALTTEGEKANEFRAGNELVVTTVRNPYDMAVSWFHKVCRAEGSFPDFLKGFNKMPFVCDHRMYAQAIGCRHVMRYERLAADVAELGDMLGLRIVLARDNVTKGKREWRSYYTQASLDVMNDRFGHEFGKWYSVVRRVDSL